MLPLSTVVTGLTFVVEVPLRAISILLVSLVSQ
jgi:hypothetical protein